MNIEEVLSKHGDMCIDEPLCHHTTFRIGGKAKYFVYPKSELSLTRIIEACMEANLPYKIIGKGSNLLCHDRDYDGVIICLDRYFIDFEFESDGKCFVQAGCSVILLANEAMKASLSGLEFASGIPATVGGTLVMNAGAYKSDISQIVKRVRVLRNQKIEWLDASEIDYAYRHSIFHEHSDWVVLAAELQLQPKDQKDIRDLMDTRRARRKESQPLEKPSAGSVFRNPDNHQAWELIEACGLREKQIGGAKVSEKHCNFIVNDEKASAKDVAALIEHIQNEVREKFNVHLHTEVEKFNWPENDI